MIPVREKPKPKDFEAKVARPGAKFLKSYPCPTSSEWAKHAYWTSVLDDLCDAYDWTCAYTAFRVHRVDGGRTVEHFVPKARSPSKAYSWPNYRLVLRTRNTNRAHGCILDPFQIEDGTFAMVFPSLEVTAGPACQGDADLAKAVEDTCRLLHLNREADCVHTRMELLRQYWDGTIQFAKLVSEAPFLAKEVERQGYRDRNALGDIMNDFKALAAS